MFEGVESKQQSDLYVDKKEGESKIGNDLAFRPTFTIVFGVMATFCPLKVTHKGPRYKSYSKKIDYESGL